MKQKHIDASREARLWIGQVIVPAIMVGAMMLSDEKIRTFVVDKKNKIISKFKKK